MQPLAVDLALLRAAAPELVLREGMTVSARVMERHGPQHGLILLGGVPLAAELPESVEAGARLRLRVADTTGNRAVLQILDAPVPPPAAAPPPVPLPGGASVRVNDEDRDARTAAGGGGHPTVSLTFAGPAAGPIDLRLVLEPGRVRATVALRPGAPLELAEDGAEGLAAALAQAAGREAEVRVEPRRDSIDVRA